MLVLLCNGLQAVALCTHFMDLEPSKPLNHLQNFIPFFFFFFLPLQTLNFFYFLNLFDLMADIKNMG